MNRFGNKFKNGQQKNYESNNNDTNINSYKKEIYRYQNLGEEPEKNDLEDVSQETSENVDDINKNDNDDINKIDNVGYEQNKNMQRVSALRKKSAGKVSDKLSKSLKSLKKTSMFLLKHKMLLIIGAIMIFVLLLSFSTFFNFYAEAEETGGGSGVPGVTGSGYYDKSGDFNQTVVSYSDESNSYDNLTLEEFVIGATYPYIQDKEICDEALKALMIVVKTNALSYGNYNNSTQNITLTNFGKGYIPTADIDNTTNIKLKDIYDIISGEIFVSTLYSGNINSLSSSDVLLLDDDNLTKMFDLCSIKGYEEILKDVYSTAERKLYKIKENVVYYNLTENDGFWWPIGSMETTTENGKLFASNLPALGKNNISRMGATGEAYGIKKNPHGGNLGLDVEAGGKSNYYNVISIGDGVVKDLGDGVPEGPSDANGGRGNYVEVDYGNGIYVRYLHLYAYSIKVSVGEQIKKGQVIGKIGHNGDSTGAHLHMDIRLNGEYVDPTEYVDPDNPRPVKKHSMVAPNSSPSTPDETKKAICQTLLASGYSNNAVAGMLVNIQAEGSFKLTNLENCYEEGGCCTRKNGSKYGYCVTPELEGFGSDSLYTAGIDSGNYTKENFTNDSAGYGLVQWTYWSRKEKLYNYFKSQNKSIATLDVQLGYLLEEVKGYAVTYKYITGNYSAYDIANNFCLDFEKPSGFETACPARAQAHSATMLTYVENGCS